MSSREDGLTAEFVMLADEMLDEARDIDCSVGEYIRGLKAAIHQIQEEIDAAEEGNRP